MFGKYMYIRREFPLCTLFSIFHFDLKYNQIKHPDETELLFKTWKQNNKSIQVQKNPKISKKCPQCNGFKTVLIYEKDYKGSRIFGSSKRIPCEYCGGNGVIISGNKMIKYKAPQKFIDYFTSVLKVDEVDFCSFQLGAPINEQSSVMQYYNTKGNIISSVQNTFGKTFRYRGNHKVDAATETRLTVFGKRLVRVEIILKKDSNTSVNEWKTYIDNNFAYLANYRVSIRQLNESTSQSSISGNKYMPENQKIINKDPFGIYYDSEYGNYFVIDAIHDMFAFLYSISETNTDISQKKEISL